MHGRKNIKTYVGLQLRGPFCYILIKIKFGRESLVKIPDIKFHENPSRGDRLVPCGQTDKQTYETNSPLISHFANAPNNGVSKTAHWQATWECVGF